MLSFQFPVLPKTEIDSAFVRFGFNPQGQAPPAVSNLVITNTLSLMDPIDVGNPGVLDDCACQ